MTEKATGFLGIRRPELSNRRELVSPLGRLTNRATFGYKRNMDRPHQMMLYGMTCGLVFILVTVNRAIGEETPQPGPSPATSQIFRASDWKGATDVAFEECKANSGEYTLWVYATATRCGVPREQADRVVLFRQPLPGVSPIRTTSGLPEGRYAVWLYGAGEAGHPWVNLCGKTCVKGELPSIPGWVPLGWIEVRDRHLLLLKTWEQPYGHQLYVQAIVLSATDTKPDWTP
jgi:hypothetical protein